MDKTIDSFIEKYKLGTDLAEFENECGRFIREMELGLNDDDKGLPMIHTYVSDDGAVPKNEKIIVMDAGGTNLRVASVYFDNDGDPVIDNFTKYTMPGVETSMTADEMFGQLAEYIMPYTGESDRIGICFSYPAQITEDRDAQIMVLAKELKVKGAEGLLVGTSLQEHLSSAGVSKKRITVVNDAVATQLAGKAASIDSCYDGYAGYILGTGMNICYTEKAENIKRLPLRYRQGGGMIINVESAYYSDFDRGYIDEKLDRESSNPGSHPLEKMMSGAYLGRLVGYVLKQAASEGFFSSRAKDMIMTFGDIPLMYTDRLYENRGDGNPLAECLRSSKEDMSNGIKLIDAVMRRTAYLNAVVIGATLKKAGAGFNKDMPAMVCADGTTFYKTVWLREHMLRFFKQLVEEKLGCHFETIKVDDAPLIGTAAAGLIN